MDTLKVCYGKFNAVIRVSDSGELLSSEDNMGVRPVVIVAKNKVTGWNVNINDTI